MLPYMRREFCPALYTIFISFTKMHFIQQKLQSTLHTRIRRKCRTPYYIRALFLYKINEKEVIKWSKEFIKSDPRPLSQTIRIHGQKSTTT